MQLGSFRKVTTPHKVSFPIADTAVPLRLSPWKSQTLSRSSAARREPGDLFESLLRGLFSWIVCPLHSPLHQHIHLCFPCPLGLSTPLCSRHADSQLWSAMSALTISAQHSNTTHLQPTLPVNIRRTACTRGEQSKALPPFKIFGATRRRCDCLTGLCTNSCIPLWVIALLCLISRATLCHGLAHPSRVTLCMQDTWSVHKCWFYSVYTHHLTGDLSPWLWLSRFAVGLSEEKKIH